jgi:hypothetical protein
MIELEVLKRLRRFQHKDGDNPLMIYKIRTSYYLI